MIDVIGWLGAFLFAICGLPQLIKSLQHTASTKGLSLIFLLMWLVGEIFTIIYVCYRAFKWPLFLNYLFNIAIVSGILMIYFFYKDKQDQDLLKAFYYKGMLLCNPILMTENFMFMILVFILVSQAP